MDAVELLNRDRCPARRLFHDYETQPDEVQRRCTVDAVVTTLSTLLALEEMIVYPLVRQVVPNGNQTADARVAAHTELKRILVALDAANRDQSRTHSLVAVLREEVEQHLRPETQLLDKLRNCVDLQMVADLGGIVEQLKQLVPASARPAPPDEPPLLPLTATIAAAYDRLWDRLQNTPKAPGTADG